MYHHLEGQLIEKHPTQVILNVNGIGYELLILVLFFKFILCY
jgi:Holliday junction resolvasome RuvABC DNA-binding subunit